MKLLATLFISFTFFSLGMTQQVDLQVISVDPEIAPLRVNEQTNVIIATVNNGPGIIPTSEATLTITVSSALTYVDMNLISDSCGIWEVTFFDEPNRTIHFATQGGPMNVDELCLITIPIEGAMEGTANINVGSSLSPDAGSSDNVGNNQSASSEFEVSGILPIELLRFSATPVDQGVELEWETATEINNSHFEIQRSADGRHYQTIGQVAGHGTTSEVISYSFLDNQPLNGKNHYRLKQVDFDGSFEYSPVKQVELSGQSHLIIYPNPAEIGSEVTIRGQEIREVKVYDMLGKLFIHEEYNRPAHEVKLSSSKLPRGMYITRINNMSEKRLVIN